MLLHRAQHEHTEWLKQIYLIEKELIVAKYFGQIFFNSFFLQ